MAGDMYRIYNRVKFDVGFYRVNGLPSVIAPGRMLLLSEDDLIYNARAFTEWLRKGTLESDSERVYELFGLSRGDEHILSMGDEEVENKLKQNLRAFTEWLDGIQSEDELGRIQLVASKSDWLTAKKIELIENKTGRKMADVRARMGDEHAK